MSKLTSATLIMSDNFYKMSVSGSHQSIMLKFLTELIKCKRHKKGLKRWVFFTRKTGNCRSVFHSIKLLTDCKELNSLTPHLYKDFEGSDRELLRLVLRFKGVSLTSVRNVHFLCCAVVSC